MITVKLRGLQKIIFGMRAMNRQNVIVVIAPTLEVWGNFKKLCEAKGFDVLPYHSLKSKPFPIIHNDWIIHKVPFL
jgi:hypothetical protein